jgi:GntR family transcriptional regulator
MILIVITLLLNKYNVITYFFGTEDPGGRVRTSIDRNSSVPYYVQLRDSLEEEIRAGNWKPGDRIPGESELCELFGVSRTVVRQALKEMSYEGRVTRARGRGTFVAEPKLSSKSIVQSLDGFYQDMAARGLETVTKVLEQGITPASPKIADYLELDPMSPVIKIVRLRYISGDPIVLVTSYLPFELCRSLVNADLTHGSLYGFLEQECELVIARGRRRIDAISATDEEAALLDVDPKAPLLKIDSISYLESGQAIEYFHGLFRGDRLRFEADIVEIKGQSKLWGTGEEGWP